MGDSVKLQVPCRPGALREVRDAVDTLGNLSPRDFDAVKLIANELVGNSIRHSDLGEHDHIDVAVETLHDRIRIDVQDEGTGFTLPANGRQGGRGLAMVQSLSSRVGITRDRHTHAWAEIALP